MRVPAEAGNRTELAVGGLPGYPGSDESAPVVLGVADWTALEAVKAGQPIDRTRRDRLLDVQLLEVTVSGSVGLSAVGMEVLIMKRAGFHKLLAKLLKTVGAEGQSPPQTSVWQWFHSRRRSDFTRSCHAGLLGAAFLRRRGNQPATVESADAR